MNSTYFLSQLATKLNTLIEPTNATALKSRFDWWITSKSLGDKNVGRASAWLPGFTDRRKVCDTTSTFGAGCRRRAAPGNCSRRWLAPSQTPQGSLAQRMIVQASDTSSTPANLKARSEACTSLVGASSCSFMSKGSCGQNRSHSVCWKGAMAGSRGVAVQLCTPMMSAVVFEEMPRKKRSLLTV